LRDRAVSLSRTDDILKSVVARLVRSAGRPVGEPSFHRSHLRSPNHRNCFGDRLGTHTGMEKVAAMAEPAAHCQPQTTTPTGSPSVHRRDWKPTA